MEWPESPSSMCPAALTMKMWPHQGHSPGALHPPPRRGPLSDPLSSLGLLPRIIQDHDAGKESREAPAGCQVSVRVFMSSVSIELLCHLSSAFSAARSHPVHYLSSHRPSPAPPASKCIFVQLSVSDYESMIMWYKRDRWLLVPSCLP